MTLHRHALQLVDALALAGGRIAAEGDGGFDLETADDALFARVAAFLGPDVPDVHTAPRRALRAVLRAQDRAARELLALPVALLQLPVPFTARFARVGIFPSGRRCVDGLITTHGAVYRAEVHARPAFLVRELVTIAQAVELGRVGPQHFDRWLAAKGRGEWTVLPERAGLPPLAQGAQPRPPTITVGELFDELGAELASVEIHAAPAASEAAA